MPFPSCSFVAKTCLLCASLVLLVAEPVQAAAPTLTHLFPAGGQRGTTVSVTCAGKFSSWPVQVDAPGIEVQPGEKSGQLELSIPEELRADRVWIRLYNAEGASAALPFLIGDLPEINETEPNNAPGEAEELEAPGLIVNGVLKGADTDTFSVPLEAGQTLVAAVDANTRIGSPTDMVLQVALPSGVVVADNHDDLGLDPRLTFTAKTSGRYLVRVFGFSSNPNTSIALQGGDNCIYRLTLTTGSHVLHTIPLSVPIENPGVVQLYGWNIPEGLPAEVTRYGHPAIESLAEREPRGDLRIPTDSQLGFARATEGVGGTRLRLVPFPTSAVIDRPVDDAPLPLELPHAVTGRLLQPGQINRYQVTLKKGDPLLINVEARTLGLPPDPLVRLLDPEQKQVAEVDDSANTRDAVLAYTAKADGTHTILVTDRHRDGGERAFYQLTARLDAPDFELTTEADAYVLPADKPAEIVVNVTRRGSAGPITIEAVDLPEGVTTEAVVSEAKGDSAKKVTLKLTGQGIAHTGPIRVVGRMTEPRELQHEALPPAKLENSVSLPNLWLTAIAAPEEKKKEEDQTTEKPDP